MTLTNFIKQLVSGSTLAVLFGGRLAVLILGVHRRQP